jgi:hypothetical protein
MWPPVASHFNKRSFGGGDRMLSYIEWKISCFKDLSKIRDHHILRKISLHSFFFLRQSSPGWTWTHDLPVSASKCWDCKCVPPCLALYNSWSNIEASSLMSLADKHGRWAAKIYNIKDRGLLIWVWKQIWRKERNIQLSLLLCNIFSSSLLISFRLNGLEFTKWKL